MAECSVAYGLIFGCTLGTCRQVVEEEEEEDMEFDLFG